MIVGDNMSLKLTNLNGDLYIIDSNNTDIKSAVANMVKINEGAFLVGKSENEIKNFDVTTIEKFSAGLNFKVRKSTKAENLLMSYIQNTLQQKTNEEQFKTIADLRTAVADINAYINSQPVLLENMKELEGKDSIIDEKIEKALESYFEEAMSKNQYFQKQVVTQPVIQEAVNVQQNIETEEIAPIENDFYQEVPANAINQAVMAQPISETIMPEPEIVSPEPSVMEQVPETQEYDEQTVTDILQLQAATPSANFNVEKLVNKYFEHLTTKQIDILLNNFKLNENLVVLLKQRKGTIQVFNSLQNAELEQNNSIENEQQNISNVVEKRKRFTLLGEKNSNKKAAFVDTLLLSFTIGTLCGVYLMYFILTIMS